MIVKCMYVSRTFIFTICLRVSLDLIPIEHESGCGNERHTLQCIYIYMLLCLEVYIVYLRPWTTFLSTCTHRRVHLARIYMMLSPPGLVPCVPCPLPRGRCCCTDCVNSAQWPCYVQCWPRQILTSILDKWCLVMTNTGQSVNKLLAYVGGVTLIPEFWQFIVCTEVS